MRYQPISDGYGSNMPRNRSDAIILLVSGVLLWGGYKLWKLFIREYLGLSVSADYFLYETYSTYFRIFSAVVGGAFCISFTRPIKGIFDFRLTKTYLVIVLYPIIYLCLRFLTADAEFLPSDSFFFELYVNFFVGFSEEIVVRGLIFLGLLKLLGSRAAIILSALAFSVWHFDVYTDIGVFFRLFLFGAALAYSYLAGVSLMTLGLIHFIWDQIGFGLKWDIQSPILYYYCLVGLDCCVIFVMRKIIVDRSFKGEAS